jgi:hypothetical protein
MLYTTAVVTEAERWDEAQSFKLKVLFGFVLPQSKTQKG